MDVGPPRSLQPNNSGAARLRAKARRMLNTNCSTQRRKVNSRASIASKSANGIILGPSLGDALVWVGFEKQPVTADHRDGGPGERFDHGPITAGRAAEPAGLLHAVRGVKHTGTPSARMVGSDCMSFTSRP